MNGYMRHGAVLIMIDITCVGGTFLRRSVPAEEHQRTGGGVAVAFIKTFLFDVARKSAQSSLNGSDMR